MPKHNFAIMGVAGFVAPRHLKAIKQTDNILVAALDHHDSVGILDQYFPDAKFFTEMERFDRFLEKMRYDDVSNAAEYLSICTPNYVHDAHCRLALRLGANAICEKPLVINPWNLDALQKVENEYGKKIYTVLQLRLHPELIKLQKQISMQSERTYKVKLTYITPRGEWYKISWKGNSEKSGGIATNIGIHLFDLLIWLFGKVENYDVYYSDDERMGGLISLEKAKVDWFLSIHPSDILDKEQSIQSYRSLTIDDEVISFSDGFADLHTEVYRQILEGKGWGITDAYPSIDLANNIRNANLAKKRNDCHPLLHKYIGK